MQNEYIIINKTKLNKKIEELEIKLKEEKDSFLPLQRIIGEDSGKIRALKETLAESTPLTPIVEDAFDAGVDYERSPFKNISHSIQCISKKDYIKNLKLEI